MREIKFRVWDKQFKRMKVTGIGLNGGVLSGEDVEIMQFTGLKDKNGKEIYEGDVVKYTAIFDSFRNGIGTIHWHDCAWCYLGDEYHGILHLMRGSELEVIGNIYENPELLSGK